MRTAAIASGGRLALTDAPDPTPGPGEVVVDVAYCGLCGSDLHMLFDYGDHMPGHVLGHELSGRVSAVAPDVTSVRVGSACTVLPITPCGTCVACTSPGPGVCLTGVMSGPGLGRPGAFAEKLLVPADIVVPLPAGVDERAGAIAEPLAVAVRAVARAGVGPDDRVCILGAGPIGLMLLAALHARAQDAAATTTGGTPTVVVELNAARRERVDGVVPGTTTAASADEAPDALGGAPTVVLDCTGHPAAVAQAVGLVETGGRVVVVGMPGEPSSVDASQLALKEMTLTGSLAYTPAEFAEAVGHLEAGRVPVDALVTGVVGFAEVQDVMTDLRSGSSPHVKVLIDPRLAD